LIPPETRQLIEYRLGEASEALGDAELLARNGRSRSALNRAYYAMFYSVLAVLTFRGLGTSKHSGAIALFDKEFVKTGLLHTRLSEWLHEAFAKRQKADYDEVTSVSEEDACQLIGRASEFCQEVARYLKTTQGNTE